MNYSPISSMRVKNFRNIGDMTIDFTESPIITLIGDNEAGKTSIVKAFCVAGLNAFSTKQKNYIREGTNGFGISIALSDGSIITRIKTNTSNQLSIQKADGTQWQASKIDKGGTPVELQAVMGLIEESETKEYLQIRTYEDKLLFVVTPGSTNYKVMYDALKVDQLMRALKLGTEQANSLRRNIDDTQVIIKALMENIRKIRLYDIEPVVNIKNRLGSQLSLIDKLEESLRYKSSINSMNKSLGAISLIEQNHLETIDATLTNILVSVNRVRNNMNFMVNKLSVYSKLDAIDEIDTTVVDKIRGTLLRKNSVKENEIKLGTYSEVSKLDSIDTVRVMSLVEAIRALHKVRQCEQELDNIDTSGANIIKESSIDKIAKLNRAISLKNDVYEKLAKLRLIEQERERLTHLLKESGAVVAECPRCKEEVVVDVRAYN